MTWSYTYLTGVPQGGNSVASWALISRINEVSSNGLNPGCTTDVSLKKL